MSRCSRIVVLFSPHPYSLLLDNERWKQAEVPAEFQDLVNSIADGRITLPERKTPGTQRPQNPPRIDPRVVFFKKSVSSAAAEETVLTKDIICSEGRASAAFHKHDLILSYPLLFSFPSTESPCGHGGACKPATGFKDQNCPDSRCVRFDVLQTLKFILIRVETKR